MRAALLCLCVQVDASSKQLLLLYADMTEEVVLGRDFDDMLVNGHLLDVDAATTGRLHSLNCFTAFHKQGNREATDMAAGHCGCCDHCFSWL